jgi:hypothetical protein
MAGKKITIFRNSKRSGAGEDRRRLLGSAIQI